MEFDETNPLDLGSATATQASEAPIIEDEADEGPISLDEPEAEATPDEETAEVEEADQSDPYEEVEIDGKRYKVPAEIKDGYLRTADYTRKTQEVAELRRNAEAQIAQVREMAAVTEEDIKARGALFQLETQLQELNQTDWHRLENEDPLEAQALWRRRQQLMEARQQVLEYQGQLAQQRGQAAERDTAKRLQETAEYAQKNIKGWTPELDGKITEFAVKELGYTLDTLKSAYNPQVYRTLYLAHIGQQALNRQQAPKPSAQTIQPTATVSAKSSPAVSKDPAEMSMAEYVAWANARDKRRR